jgi:hypothetical protein
MMPTLALSVTLDVVVVWLLRISFPDLHQFPPLLLPLFPLSSSERHLPLEMNLQLSRLQGRLCQRKLHHQQSLPRLYQERLFNFDVDPVTPAASSLPQPFSVDTIYPHEIRRSSRYRSAPQRLQLDMGAASN